MYNIHGFKFSNTSEIADLMQGSANVYHVEEVILDRMIRKGLEIDHVYMELCAACVDYCLGEGANKDQKDELLGVAFQEWKAYTVETSLPWSVKNALLDAETESERRDALEDYEA